MEIPLEEWPALSDELGIVLKIKRDDLLPFPLPGNKYRKLAAEFAALTSRPDVVITTGGVNSNHCRTMAMIAAQQCIRASIVLHGHKGDSLGEGLLRSLGADTTYVDSSQIGATMREISNHHQSAGATVHTIRGGCHTAAGARSYADAVVAMKAELADIDVIVLATGTGATQGGLVAGVSEAGLSTRVVGVSVARLRDSASAAVLEAADWCGRRHVPIEVTDHFIDGGYGKYSEQTLRIVDFAWRRGLPLDPVYTGKAFRSLFSLESLEIERGSRVLFWHTGGLANYLDATRP